MNSRATTSAIGPLYDAYIECAMPTSIHTAELAAWAALASDVERLRALAAATSDPMPWRIFLLRLAEVPPWAETDLLRRAWAQLYAVSAEMLRGQGLGLVHPEDVLLEGGIVEQAIDNFVSAEPS